MIPISLYNLNSTHRLASALSGPHPSLRHDTECPYSVAMSVAGVTLITLMSSTDQSAVSQADVPQPGRPAATRRGVRVSRPSPL